MVAAAARELRKGGLFAPSPMPFNPLGL